MTDETHEHLNVKKGKHLWKINHFQCSCVLGLAHVLFKIIEGKWVTYTAAHHQGAIRMLRLHF